MKAVTSDAWFNAPIRVFGFRWDHYGQCAKAGGWVVSIHFEQFAFDFAAVVDDFGSLVVTEQLQ